MSGRIPQTFIDDLLARVDIVQVIEPRVPLRKAGPEYKACCPFHNEKTPSFTVSPSKQFYHCFGCGAHGSALGFLIEYERLDFVDAVETLARDVGVEVPREGGEPHQQTHAPLLNLLRRCSELFQARLQLQPDALDYLQARGLGSEARSRFSLGFAPDRWDWLMGQFPASERKLLEQAGMLSRNERDRVYDRFRGRLMFPITNRRGEVIAFGGRVIGEGGPKYLNSPETPLFHKGRELYGLHQALHAPERARQLLVVEGYMDVIALAEQGIDGAIATLGTATTDEHLHTIYRHVTEVVFCFDGDAAGRRAAEKALHVALPHVLPGREARFLFLPQGEDPDSLVRSEGQAAFRQRLESARPLADFLFESLGQGLDLGTEAGRAGLVERFRPVAEKLPKTIYTSMLHDRLARTVRVERREIDRALGSAAGSAQVQLAKPRQPRRSRSVAVTPMRLLIALLLKDPALHARINADDPFLSSAEPGVSLLNRILSRCRQTPAPNPGVLLEWFRDDPDESSIHKLFAWQAPDPETAEQSFLDALDKLRDQYRHRRRAALIALSRQRPLNGDEKLELKNLFTSAD